MSDMEQLLFLNSKRFWSFYRLKQRPKQLPVKLEGSGNTSEGSSSKQISLIHFSIQFSLRKWTKTRIYQPFPKS